MNSFKRYSSSFFITIIFYSLVFFVIFFSYDKLYTPILKEEKKISLNHISFTSQEKIVKVVKKEEIKEEIKIPEKVKKIIKKPSKKIIKKIITKKEIQKKVIKKEPIKKLVKEKKETIKEIKEIVTKIEDKNKKEQNLIKKITKRTYEEDFIKEHLDQIVKLIQKNIKYPKRAKRLNIQGDVLIEFTILENGDILNIKGINGHKFLIKSSINAIKNASDKFPKVKKNIILKVPIKYTLS